MKNRVISVRGVRRNVSELVSDAVALDFKGPPAKRTGVRVIEGIASQANQDQAFAVGRFKHNPLVLAPRTPADGLQRRVPSNTLELSCHAFSC